MSNNSVLVLFLVINYVNVVYAHFDVEMKYHNHNIAILYVNIQITYHNDIT